jgi:hypothetical protein
MKGRMQGVFLSAAVSMLVAGTASAQTVGSADIIDGSIQAIDIAPETITTGRILNGTIQAIDIAPESITTGRILNRTIKAIDIATESITTAEIKNGTIDAIDLAPETITTGRIKNETIQAIDIAPESITTGRILNRTIKAIDIATESITTGEIKNGSIAGVDLANGAVTAAKLGLARTTYIQDSGNAAANCAALLDALDGLTGPAAVVLGPGTFDCGGEAVELTANVSLIGSGQNLTVVTGSKASHVIGLAGDGAAVESLTVVNNAALAGSNPRGITIGSDGGATTNWRLISVTARALNGTVLSAGIATASIDCDGGRMLEVTAEASGGTSFNFGVNLSCSAGTVAATDLRASASDTEARALVKDGNSTLTVQGSAFSAATSAERNVGTLRVIASELDGAVSGAVICVGAFDENGAALANGQNGIGGCI